MKLLIWATCFFVLVFVQVIIKNNGIVLGGIPTVLLYLAFILIGRALTKPFDKKENDEDESSEDSLSQE